jgi:predicted Zn-dependent peptidase
MTVVVAGNVHLEAMHKEIEKYFGDVKKFKVKEYEKYKEKQTGPIVMLKHKNTEQAHFALGVRTVGLHDKKDRYPLELLASILGGGMSSRLFYEIRERRGISYYARTSSDHYLDVGYMATYVGADPKRIDEAIQVVLDEYAKVTVKGEITEEELKKAKEYTKGHFVLELEDTRSAAIMYASQEILQEELHNPHDVIERIEKVKLEDIERVAKTYLDTKALSLAVIGNFQDKSRFEKLLK